MLGTVRLRRSVAALLMLATSSAVAQSPLGTTFNYQGYLQDGGSPASGLHDLRFRLYDAAVGGMQVGATLCLNNVSVMDGLFAELLDFGVGAFDGDARWLEVEVRKDTGLDCATPFFFELLAPRQELTLTPNAAFALNAASAAAADTAMNAYQLNGQAADYYQNASNLTAGTLATPRLPNPLSLIGDNPVAATIFGQNDSAAFQATGMFGLAAAGSGATNGVRGDAVSPDGIGVLGYNGTASGTTTGVMGVATSVSGRGVVGWNQATSGLTTGVYGLVHSPSGRGVLGESTSTDAGVQSFGVVGVSNSPAFGSAGVRGINNSGGQVIGVEGISQAGDAGTGIVGRGSATGGYFESFGPSGGFASTGVYTVAADYGVYAESSGSAAGRFVASSPANAVHATLSGTGIGSAGRFHNSATFGDAMYVTNDAGGYTLAFRAISNFSSCLRGESYGTGDHIGVYGQNTSSASPFAWGVFAAGRLGANGAKFFQIDHPLYPEEKVLQHYCAEGNEPRLSYVGRVTLDANGEAWVQLPDYFEAINRAPEYQLTCIGGYAPVYVAHETERNRFKIAGGRPGLQVSWRVDGIRNDRYVQRHGIAEEVEKPEHLKGKYVSPELYGMPAEHGIYYRPAPPASGPTPQCTQRSEGQ
jgi:hypothetical protein